jgi:hypothetical protein
MKSLPGISAVHCSAAEAEAFFGISAFEASEAKEAGGIGIMLFGVVKAQAGGAVTAGKNVVLAVSGILVVPRQHHIFDTLLESGKAREFVDMIIERGSITIKEFIK